MFFRILFIGTLCMFVYSDDALYTIEDFHSTWFWSRPDEGMYLVNAGLPNETTSDFQGSKLMAMGTLNNDKLNDVLLTNEAQTSFQVGILDAKTYTYTMSEFFTFSECPFIQGAVICKDPVLFQEVLLICQDVDTYNWTYLVVAEQYEEAKFQVNTASPLHQFAIQYNSQPFIVDINGDLKKEYVYNSVDGELMVLVFNSDNTQVTSSDFNSLFIVTSDEDSECLQPTTTDLLSQPHSSSFLDLDGDCLPDLFLTKENSTSGTQYYEIYQQQDINGYQKYCLVYQEEMLVDSTTNEIPLIDFGDIDKDAMIDMIFYVNNYIYIFYNRFVANSASDSDLCREAYATSYYMSNKMYTSPSDFDVDLENVTTQYYADALGITNSSMGVAGRTRLGDMDADGYPDMAMSLEVNLTSGVIVMNTSIYMNEACTDALCGREATDKGRRYLNSIGDTYSLPFQSYAQGDTSLAVFLDIDEDGKLDLLIQKLDANTGLLAISCIYNNFIKDSFFLKAMMSNTQDYYGDLTIGPSYRFIATDLSDTKYVVIGTQLYQNTYSALLMPYAFLGVGRSNNYVETFTSTYSIDATKTTRVWTPIIPNSQLVIFAVDSNSADWKLELFINPTQSLPLIVAACLVCLILIGIVIIFLHIGEKQEDKKQQKQWIYF